jgi:colanic acid/amylovoran biosynthesis glycosyltransferase
MKILFITWKFPSFACTFILNEIVELVRQGHEVLIGSLCDPSDNIEHPDVSRYRLRDRTFYFSAMSNSGDSLTPHLKSFVCPVLSPYASSFASVARMIKKRGIEFIHGDFANLGATASMILSELSGVPFSFETHSLDLYAKFSHAGEKLSKAAFVTTESYYNKIYLVDVLGAAADRVRVIRLCPNIGTIDSLPEIPRNPRRIVSVCRLHPIKGLEYAIAAISQVVKRFSDIRYDIIGEGPLEQSIRDLVAEHKLCEHVRLLGPLPNDAALLEIKKASVFLLPSVIDPSGDRDGTPTAIAEAMWLGTPVVSSHICGIPEMIEHPRCGYLSEPGDIAGLVSSICGLISNPSVGAEIAEAARRRARVLFDTERNVRNLVSEFQMHEPSQSWIRT